MLYNQVALNKIKIIIKNKYKIKQQQQRKKGHDHSSWIPSPAEASQLGSIWWTKWAKYAKDTLNEKNMLLGVRAVIYS